MRKGTQIGVFKWTAAALATAVLFGCGGSDKSADETNEAASVSITETAAGLSVKTSTADGSSSASAVQAALYSFTGAVASGTDAGQSLDGMLVLKSVLQDDGSTALTGKLVGGKITTPASDAVVALQTEFAAALEALKTAYKTDLDALKETLKAALDAAATPNQGRRLNEAQRAALKTFADAVKARSEQYQTDVTALVTTYRDKVVAAGGDASSIGLNPRQGRGHSKTVYEVAGTQAADGSLTLTLTAGESVINVTGTLATDGSLSGAFTGPATDDAGTWTATALVKGGHGGATPPSPPASAASSVR